MVTYPSPPGEPGSNPPEYGPPSQSGPPQYGPPPEPQYGPPPQYGQPQYAQPQYDAPPAYPLMPPAPPTRRHGKLLGGITAVIVLAGGGVATYVAVSDTSSDHGAASPRE